jgi:hypothetical protein
MILILASFDLATVAVIHLALVLESIDPSKKIPIIEGQLQIFSLSAMLTMTLERYAALVYPFFHHRFATKSRLLALLVMLQLPFTVIHTAMQITQNFLIGAVFLALIIATFIATFVLNYKIWLVARRLQLHTPMVPLGGSNGYDPCYLNKNQHKVTIKKISTCSLAVACLTVCFLPHFVYFILILTGQLQNLGVIFTFHLWADTFLGMNSSFNCVIFFYMNSTLRRHGWQIVRTAFNIKD